MREPGMKVTAVGDAFAAFYNVEYGGGLTQEEKDAAWQDIEYALTNLLEMTDFYALLLRALHLIPQRSLTFEDDGVKAQMQPDLIVFFRDRPPLIIDWKVHTFTSQDYRLQLALYALALIQCKPHKDFPIGLDRYHATDIQLTEVQLLTQQQRHYQLTESDIDTVSNYMAQTALDMALAVDVMDEELCIQDLPTTQDPNECQRCPFRSLCWE